MRLKDEKFYKTVRDFLDIYLIRHRGYSLNTQKSYREAINLLLLYFKAERGLEYSNVGFEDITYSNRIFLGNKQLHIKVPSAAVQYNKC